MSGQVAADLGDEMDRYVVMRADLEDNGYLDITHEHLRPGQRVRHRGEQWPEAHEHGTAVVLAVMERPDSAWSRTYGGPDIELIVLRDKPLFEGSSRLSQLANYHVAPIAALEAAADAADPHRMLPGSHEQPGGPECVCGEEWSRWDDMCARQHRAAAAAAEAQS